MAWVLVLWHGRREADDATGAIGLGALGRVGARWRRSLAVQDLLELALLLHLLDLVVGLHREPRNIHSVATIDVSAAVGSDDDTTIATSIAIT